VHRMASGTHKSWANGASKARELHIYPASRGQILRHVGGDLEQAVELLCDHHLSNIQVYIESAKKAFRTASRRMLVGRRRKRSTNARI
jgi:hypothetical protein